VEHLIGDASKARRVLGWEPKVDFEQLIRMMVDADLALLRREQALRSWTPPSEAFRKSP
jgi:GDPmannose 4,6-dehydratase